MTRSIDYQMTDEDWGYANQIVQVRKRTKSRKPTAELEGAAAEVAFAMVFGLDLPSLDRNHGDGGVDFILPSGASVDVKAISGTPIKVKGLLVPKRIRAGLYVLVHISFEDGLARLLGYQTGGYAAAFGEDKFDHYRVSQVELLPMYNLMEG